MRKGTHNGTANNRNLVVNSASMLQDEVTTEVFGSTMKSQITRAKTIIYDFARYNTKLRNDLDDVYAKLESCVRSAQISMVMSEVRHKYL